MQTALFAEDEAKKDANSFQSFNAEFTSYELVKTPKKLLELASLLDRERTFAFDTETDSVDAMSANMVGISISTDPGIGWYIPLNTMGLSLDQIQEQLRPIFADKHRNVIAHNYKFDYKIMENHGFELNGKVFDTMVAGYLVDHIQTLKMDYLSKKYLDYEPISIDGLIGDGRTMFDIPVEEVSIYACEDADITYRLYDYFKDKLRDEGMEDLAYNIEFPTTKILAEMETTGVALNTEFLRSFDEELDSMLKGIKSKMFDMAGKQFNPNSYLQVGEVLYDDLGLPVIEKTDSGNRATGEDVLNKLKEHHDFPELLLEYRSVDKLRGTYVTPLPKKVNSSTGRLHGNFNQTRTATGRLSSSDPNLQNIPTRTELGNKVRRAFVAPEGRRLISADYSQQELRIIASICKDPKMLEIFNNGDDIHTATAAEIYDKAQEEVGESERYNAKTINYSLAYGAGAKKLSDELTISESKAKILLDSYFRKFKEVKSYLDSMHSYARDYGYVETLFGRRRYLPNIHANNQWKRFQAERQAGNSPIQGTAADQMKMAMIDIDNWIKQTDIDVHMIMAVHDEVVLEAPKQHVEEVASKVCELMENTADFGVPMIADYGISTTWEEGH